MRIRIYSKEYTEENHVSKRPLVLLEHLKEVFEDSFFKVNTCKFEVDSVISANNLIVLIEDSWLKFSEYNLLLNYIIDKNIDLNVVNNFEISYVGGLMKLEKGEYIDYYTTIYKLQNEPELFKTCEADIKVHVVTNSEMGFTKEKFITNEDCN